MNACVEKSKVTPLATVIGTILTALLIVPVTEDALAFAVALMPATVIEAPEKDATFPKLMIAPPVVTSAEVYGPAGFVLHTEPF